MTFQKQIELTIKAFFFNAKTDYLPYYKNFSFTVNEEDNLLIKDILPMIKEQNFMFSYPDKDLLFKVNGWIVTGEEKLSRIIEKLGTNLTIDPPSKYRSINGLIINNHDFIHKYRRLFSCAYAKKECLSYYMDLYPQHYASETFEYNKEYEGDAILILAKKLIENDSQCKDKILEAISDEFNGINQCEYENNVFDGKDYHADIEWLRVEINKYQKVKKHSLSIIDKLKSYCINKKRKPIKIDSLNGKNISFYIGYNNNNTKDLMQTYTTITKIGKYIPFSMSKKTAGQTLIKINPSMAYRKAGRLLLEAFDNGAEVLVFAKDEDYNIFTSIIADVEIEVGRPIPLALISISEFKELDIYS